jgi:hypothetical protein
MTAALGSQIMVDPRLAQSSNTDAVRPPTRPESGAVPDSALAADPVDAKTLKRAPAASNDCPECKAADFPTLGGEFKAEAILKVHHPGEGRGPIGERR